MNESLISVRYATALFSLAKEQNLLMALKEDVELILQICNQSADFNRMLNSPVVKPSGKIKVFKQVFGNRINRLSMNFLELAVRNNRENFIASICINILDFIRKEKNIKTAVITTAQSLDEVLLRKVEKILEKELNGKVELTTRVNSGLIGGLVLRIDDKQLDAAVSTQLKNLKQEMLKTKV